MMYAIEIFLAVIAIVSLVVVEKLIRRRSGPKTPEIKPDAIKPQNITKNSHNNEDNKEDQKQGQAAITVHPTVLDNLIQQSCIARSLASGIPSSGSNTTHFCSIVDNSALIAWTSFENLLSPRSTFIKHELVNLDTHAREDIDIGSEGALLMRHYIVTGFGDNHTSGVVYCKNRIQVIDRSTDIKKDIELKDFPSNKFGLMRVNDKPDFNTVAISSNLKFFVVDVSNGNCKVFSISEHFGYQDFIYKMNFQLCGKYLAYSSSEMNHELSTDKFRLEVIDTEKGNICYAEGSDEFNIWTIDDYKILLASVTENNFLKWKLIDFSGKIISQHNIEEKSKLTANNVSAANINGGIISIAHRSQMFFYNAQNGQPLSSVSILGNNVKPEFTNPQIYTASQGKFIYSQRFNTKIFDFESEEISKFIKVRRVTPSADVHEGSIKFCNAMAFAAEKLNVPQTDLTSLYVSLSDSQKRSAIIFNSGKSSKSLKLHDSATDLLQNWKPNLSLDLVHVKFTEQKIILAQRTDVDQEFPVEVRGDVVFFNEQFIDNKWTPVDCI